jgi:hypothetical protein
MRRHYTVVVIACCCLFARHAEADPLQQDLTRDAAHRGHAAAPLQASASHSVNQDGPDIGCNLRSQGYDGGNSVA